MTVARRGVGRRNESSSPVIRELATSLLSRVDDLAIVLRDKLLANDDVYASTDMIAPDELLRSCHDNMMRVLEVLAGRLPQQDEGLDATRRTAQYRADAGFPLDSLLHAFRLGTEVVWAALLEEARTNSPHRLGELMDSAVQVMQLIDRMSLEVATVYRSREAEAERRISERRQAVLDSLLEGRGGDPEVAAEAARVLQLPDQPRFAVVVVRHDTPSASPAHSPSDGLAAYGFQSQWRLRSDREIGLVLLGKAPVERMVSLLRGLVTKSAGVSTVFDGLGDVATAFRLAELALETVPQNEPLVAHLDERLPEALLTASPLVTRRLRQQTIGGLLALEPDKRQTLFDTLNSWFRHSRSAAEVGEELHCHRNTVLHRLSRVESLCGLSLSDDRDVLLLRLALLTE
ncbi:hypothetical protein FB384_001881 [Prauserella sediminis]|uniref:PucR family transcriptional regulator n=1 Tax=Prauserella sediminis TaxID=577680 RepID=A0A839XK96_9PSEU|nr:helix-turn-helix domain-containing protein [Prauserella sediminis]MBB3662977.1 hypothetical protein [Prauserella sediminis]